VTAYDQLISRAGSGSDPLVPEPVSTDIIQMLPTQCAILQRAKSVPMSTKTNRLPVLDVLPVAYWVGGDTGLKSTTRQQWKNVVLVAEELATIVPIPEAYLADADVPIWDEVRPRLAEAIGRKLDEAALFGLNRPSTWSPSIYEGANTATNTVTSGTGPDLGVDVASLGETLALDGYSVNGFIARPGLGWKLISMRSAQGIPIYNPDMQGTQGKTLYGYGLSEVDNGSWNASEAELIAGDWSNALLGLRADISFKIFTEGVISDDSGAVILNLMQQDSVAMRVTMRVAFATANPVTELNADSATRYPFGVLKTA
jgi:HK97 family phage major capsid protein